MTENTYWENNGKYQKEYDQLFAELVPAIGKASTPEGELLRSISNLYYDLYNNGWGNWDDYLEERGIILNFLRANHQIAVINWGMSGNDIPYNAYGEYGQKMEKVTDFIIAHIWSKHEQENQQKAS